MRGVCVVAGLVVVPGELEPELVGEAGAGHVGGTAGITSSCVGITCTGRPFAAFGCFHTSTNLTMALPCAERFASSRTGAIALQGAQLSDPKSMTAGTLAAAMSLMLTEDASNAQMSPSAPAAYSPSAPAGSPAPLMAHAPTSTMAIMMTAMIALRLLPAAALSEAGRGLAGFAEAALLFFPTGIRASRRSRRRSAPCPGRPPCRPRRVRGWP